MNASSNASVGKLRKHPCGALGAGKQQRLAAGGSRGAPVARLASAGARGRSMEKNTQTSSLHRKAEPRPCTQVSLVEGLGSTAEGGEKQRIPEFREKTQAGLRLATVDLTQTNNFASTS